MEAETHDRPAARRTRLTRLLATTLLLTAPIALAACGGSNRNKSYGSNASNAYDAYYGPKAPQNASAGSVPSLPVSGNVLADDGFRPKINGFSIQNYGNDGLFVDGVPDPSKPVENMTAAQVQALFGDQVCASGTGDTCQLTPPAQQWLDEANKEMAGGHCMGFSVTALRIFDGNLKVSNLGSATDTFGLPADPTVQQTIAEGFMYQNLPAVQNNGVQGTPNQIVDRLIADLKNRTEYYTVTIFKRDGSGGHAVTPFAVVDHGGGKWGILIYDNNFPGAVREIEVNRDANTWKYTGGPNPNDLTELYEGDAQTQSLGLLPTVPGQSLQPCPFCNGQDINKKDSHAGSVLGAAQQYDQIALIGDPSNHAHLVLTDDQGRQAGVIDGRVVSDIPGVKVVQQFSDQVWKDSPDPTFHIPTGLPVTVTIDGTNLKQPDKEQLDLTGPGEDSSVQEIRVEPGQKETVHYFGPGSGFEFTSDPSQKESPILAAGIQRVGADFGFAVKALNLAGGSKIGLKLDNAKGQLDVDTTGTNGAGDYVVSVYRDDASGQTQWTTNEVPIHLEAGEVAHIDYLSAPKAGEPLDVTIKKLDGSTKTERIPPDKTK